MTWNTIEQFMVHLRNNFRLKVNCDYAVVFKFQELRILCNEAFKERIGEEAEKYGIVITEWFTYI